MNSQVTQDLYDRAKHLIPGGTQLLSKRPELFVPEIWPAYYSRAEGCRVWDLDGREYIDMSTMGIGTCILGYADPDVNRAVIGAVESGSMSSLNCPEEVELCSQLCELHPWAEMARYTRSGGEAMSVAVRIARAYSRRDKVLFCGYHGWHDWYISANLRNGENLDEHLLSGLEPNGVPAHLAATSIPFHYNDKDAFLDLIEKYGDEVGVVVIEPVRSEPPDAEFIEAIRDVTRERDIVFVVDEITSGFRLNLGGAHLEYDMVPDMAVFAKGISNGYPMAAILGSRNIMEAAQSSFISSTYWTEKIGPVAALATLAKMRACKVQDHLVTAGEQIQAAWLGSAKEHGLDLSVSGIAPLSHFSFNHENPGAMKTAFTQLMLERGFLTGTALYTSYAHGAEELEQYFAAVDATFATLGAHLDSPEDLLEGPVCHSGFERLN